MQVLLRVEDRTRTVPTCVLVAIQYSYSYEYSYDPRVGGCVTRILARTRTVSYSYGIHLSRLTSLITTSLSFSMTIDHHDSIGVCPTTTDDDLFDCLLELTTLDDASTIRGNDGRTLGLPDLSDGRHQRLSTPIRRSACLCSRWEDGLVRDEANPTAAPAPLWHCLDHDMGVGTGGRRIDCGPFAAHAWEGRGRLVAAVAAGERLRIPRARKEPSPVIVYTASAPLYEALCPASLQQAKHVVRSEDEVLRRPHKAECAVVPSAALVPSGAAAQLLQQTALRVPQAQPHAAGGRQRDTSGIGIHGKVLVQVVRCKTPTEDPGNSPRSPVPYCSLRTAPMPSAPRSENPAGNEGHKERPGCVVLAVVEPTRAWLHSMQASRQQPRQTSSLQYS